ncbi:lipid kinase, YegS/Rv2252/BmrU family [Aerococcus viridans ATCC 11563 = CCUG 4311]|uniref:Diacylglycerol kinase n=3 Tax=Aerococcus viridans TaxID=1377 RepID=A0AAU8U5V6_9LACT|nr:diacylglycerol kinase [Aerococcus viridans]EFG49750.1 lipid kinase, YegS/Rv2252/BmrU family [Aerococcus viridans ATCC 11563 = CCUG 4311]
MEVANMSKVRLIINPSSGKGTGKEIQSDLEKALSASFDDVETKFTEGEGDAKKWAREASDEGYEAVVVVGGDGTVNEGISGIAETDSTIKFGLIPLGTANDLARALGISLKPQEAAKDLANFKTRKIDIAKINDQYFCNVAAIGSIPTAVMETSSEDKSKFGFFAYVRDSMRAVLNDNQYTYNLVLDDDKEIEISTKVLVVALTNSVGSFENMIANATPDDGLLHIMTLKDENLFAALPSMLQELNGGYISEANNMITYNVKKVAISVVTEDADEVKVNIDGEVGPALPIAIEVLPSHVEVMVPNK